MLQLFRQHYQLDNHDTKQYRIAHYTIDHAEQDAVVITLTNGQHDTVIKATADGVLATFVQGLSRFSGSNIDINHYAEHAIEGGSQARAIAFVQLSIDGADIIGIAEEADIVTAPLAAVLASFNRHQHSIAVVAASA